VQRAGGIEKEFTGKDGCDRSGYGIAPELGNDELRQLVANAKGKRRDCRQRPGAYTLGFNFWLAALAIRTTRACSAWSRSQALGTAAGGQHWH
jgi:hypothetical protein